MEGQQIGVEEGHSDDSGVDVIRPVDDAQGQEQIFYVAGGRSDLRALIGEAAGLVVDACIGDAALCRLEGGDAAEGGRNAQAAARVGCPDRGGSHLLRSRPLRRRCCRRASGSRRVGCASDR